MKLRSQRSFKELNKMFKFDVLKSGVTEYLLKFEDRRSTKAPNKVEATITNHMI